MMQQYEDAKAVCGDALLFFRMGDFYELFREDAETAAPVLGLALTSRDKSENPTMMAGFPHHQMENYLGKLIDAGFRVAICDQVEDPKEAKGLVRREVTRIVTPGTLTDDALLDPCKSNYLAAVVYAGSAKKPNHDFVGLAWIEISTGRFHAQVVPAARLSDEIARIGPAECLVPEEDSPLPSYVKVAVASRPGWAFALDTARQTLGKQFGTTTLDGFGFEDSDGPAIAAAGAIIDYLNQTHKTSLDHIDRLTRYQTGSVLEIDESTRRSLEITKTIREGRREGSLLATLDRTVTAMGSRLLADWVANPLTDIEQIRARHDAIEELLSDSRLSDDLRSSLGGVYDVERLLSRIMTGRSSPRDLSFLGRTLAALPHVKAKLASRRSELLSNLEAELDICADVRSRLEGMLIDDCPLSANDGAFVRTGYNDKLDELREMATGGREWIAAYQAAEAEQSGITSLKIGYNRVFGYYIEVTNTHRDAVPEHYIRKQTLKNAERYITPELKEYEEKVLSADEKAKSLEYDLFIELRDFVRSHGRRLQITALVLAQLDVLTGLTELARQRNYCRPEMCGDRMLEIREGRHPVLDVTEPDGTFVPNDTIADPDDCIVSIITGPNMAGKSTYIRQVALITLMAQMGSYVPAAQATIGIADRIFARVGASDELSRGFSTFMVEMTDTARILNMASERSLVILDEIGRGTSTYDGVSLAWAVVEHLHDKIGCRTLFATHYHELTDLADSLSAVKNFNVAVREWQEEIVFLHKIIEGSADKSYGIHVARLAGVPKEVNHRAKEILARLEEEHLDKEGRPKISQKEADGSPGQTQLSLFGMADHPLLDTIRQADLNTTTPLDALTLIKQWQDELSGERQAKPR